MFCIIDVLHYSGLALGIPLYETDPHQRADNAATDSERPEVRRGEE
jgi:hypothetical protein